MLSWEQGPQLARSDVVIIMKNGKTELTGLEELGWSLLHSCLIANGKSPQPSPKPMTCVVMRVVSTMGTELGNIAFSVTIVKGSLRWCLASYPTKSPGEYLGSRPQTSSSFQSSQMQLCQTKTVNS